MSFVFDYDTNLSDVEVHFLGLLANANEDVLRLRLARGFEIAKLPETKGNALLADLERVSIDVIEADMNIRSLSWGGGFFAVTNTFDGGVTTAAEENEGIVLDADYNDAARVSLYLEPAVQCLRLATCKDIRLAFEYYYTLDHGHVHLKRKAQNPHIRGFRPGFSLGKEQLILWERLMKEDTLLFKHDFLKLAFRYFESSFETVNREQAFLSLIIALEIMLETKGVSLAHSVANLLSTTNQEEQQITTEIAQLYRRRNQIVHEGVFHFKGERSFSPDFGEGVILTARDFVKRVILKAVDLDMDKRHFLLYVRGASPSQ